ncbi:MAG: cob(I)yrinic acid a,c-diamide adenosyltransferase [Chloroflexi bacterium]|jgi:cob(I)alamin adenosyltransferase|nr:cob(I)yrinic acid a,c-diamide adenosyltransferase [Chloroflexota bacterium]MBT3668745.1 cob(I)yrinic acid a,c-diamide adenosyltransferase [Chloroflexota bacterium]MBT4001909.1 cob(I)yrinic acid a,c-diamide adenosyltransferase [Chloroflexota bacterium]MBT4305446.1 cob(I)yrinic acid a,c-diamide adenosyltransferase [Chloroflexota bacterium]MBT4533057.1 cob(I)yrinic acid a,c-diamide adenosyltransferase [Chloroflexota bacterium]
MPKLTKLYTRKGDDGTTALGTRKRVPKDSLRINSYGTVDELNSVIGLAMAQGLNPRLMESLATIQNELFHLGSDLAFPPEDETKVPRIEQKHVDALEKLIDGLNEEVGPLLNFVLPGGTVGAASLQLARTVCRRAERICVTLSREEEVSPLSMAYLNRLSDALFVMGRFENKEAGIEEPVWDSMA